MTRANSQDLLLYWSPETAAEVLRRERILDHVASNQLWRASSGDTIWVVTVRDGELLLISKLLVDVVTNRIGAINRLGADNVWGNKKHYAIAPANQIEPLKEASIASIANQIRFKSTNIKRTRLDIASGNRVNAQQLQTMRILEGTSAALLKQVWARLNKP